MNLPDQFVNLNDDKCVVNAQIREYIAALLVARDRLNADEEHLKDFIDLAIMRFKSKIEYLNEETAKASRRLPKPSR